MSFLAPVFALFGLLFAVPIAIHLMGRSRAKVVRFAALDLLLRSERKVARRNRVRQFLLLTVRALAIAAVPLILARPYLETASDLPSAVSASQSAVIVVDDSLSMSYEVRGERLIDRAKTRAHRLVAALGPDAEAALLLGSHGATPPVAELTADRSRLDHAIDEIRPSYRTTDLSGALRRAAQLLHATSRPTRRVYLLSDLAAHGLDHQSPWPNDASIELIPLDMAEGVPRDNRAVSDLRIDPAPHLGSGGVRISVEITNASEVAAKELPVTLRIDGKPVAKGFVDIAPHGNAVKRFFHSFDRSSTCTDGSSHCTTRNGETIYDLAAEIAPDALAADDKRFARVALRRDLRVLLVDGDPRTVRRDDELFYLEAALRPGDRDESQLELTTIGADELARRPLSEYDVLFLCNLRAPAGAHELREFVEQGGGLFIALGDNVDVDSYNAVFGDLLPQPLQSLRSTGESTAAGDSGHGGEALGRLDRTHPMLQSIVGDTHNDDTWRQARFVRYGMFKPASERGPRAVVAHFESGSPALIETQVGAGRVLVFASSIDRDWNDLAIQPIFLPLMQQAARYLARAPMRAAEHASLIGERHEVSLAEGIARVEVTLPSGKPRLYERDRVFGRHALGFDETDEPGLYRVAMASDERGPLKAAVDSTFVVNVDARESDLRRVSAEELAQLSGEGAPKRSAAIKNSRRRVELWHAMGGALLLLLLGEALLLGRQ